MHKQLQKREDKTISQNLSFSRNSSISDQLLIRNWSLVRIIKVGIGLACLLSFPKHEEYIILFVGLYFLMHGLLNAGCNDNCPT